MSNLHASTDIPVAYCFGMQSWQLMSAFDVCRYNKPLLPKYEAAERNVQLKQQAIEKKIAGRRINQVHFPFLCTAHA